MDKKTLASMIVFALVWINSYLAAKGFKTLPVLDETQVAFGIAFVVSVYTTIRHNFFGRRGTRQKELLKQHNLIKK